MLGDFASGQTAHGSQVYTFINVHYTFVFKHFIHQQRKEGKRKCHSNMIQPYGVQVFTEKRHYSATCIILIVTLSAQKGSKDLYCICSGVYINYDYVLNIKSSGVKFLCYINFCSYLLTFNDVRQGRLQKNMIAHKSFFQHNS